MASKELDFLNGIASEVAPKLLGCIIERDIDGVTLRGRIVETEAYDQTDVASHSYNGETPRTKVMFGPAGYLYVYFTYGMHYCCNVVVGEDGYGAAVLIRAVEPLEGIDEMERRRGKSGLLVANGPAKFCQAFGIGKEQNGVNLKDGEIRLVSQPPLSSDEITVTTRIGISEAKEAPWRFYITTSPWVSKK